MFNIEGGFHQPKYKVYYIKSFPKFFTKLVKEKMKEKGVTKDSLLAHINQCINEVLELECARHRLKKDSKQHMKLTTSFVSRKHTQKHLAVTPSNVIASLDMRSPLLIPSSQGRSHTKILERDSSSIDGFPQLLHLKKKNVKFCIILSPKAAFVKV